MNVRFCYLLVLHSTRRNYFRITIRFHYIYHSVLFDNYIRLKLQFGTVYSLFM